MADFSGPNIKVHDEVTDQTVEKELEGCGTILFNKEVADPSEAISKKKGQRDPLEAQSEHRGKKRKNSQGCAHKVQEATTYRSVL